jgi:cytochrome b561
MTTAQIDHHITLPSGFADAETYDAITIRLHWATALLVVLLWTIGRITPFLPRGSFRIDIWSVHVLLGFTLAAVLIARIGWRLTRGRRLPPAERGIRHLLAAATHGLLYLLLVTVVALGVVNVFAHAFPLFNLWHFPKFGDAGFGRAINGWHNLAANVTAAVALFHAAAALFHHYVVHDGVLRRMSPRIGRATAPRPR